ncbi:hypothetical protein COY32_04185 [candidate division WWE3 bacterium CG_4_10_14_0_2_um_filter_41_14]|uniref:Uncharacterized protein n=1 Tax=candidate division WWE3 bacterium CG_4_10_14_0_2_um_filter_41_14 TaxID=1975072 RepID=A0A2M7TI44_UNCKA|nr:MAG: hypothetical protein COY32_04185 [candidate division WWE3 bacterium CG_4_10_14_0_2_um_filter_41_14]
MSLDPKKLETLQSTVEHTETPNPADAVEFLKSNGMPNPDDYTGFVEHCSKVLARIEGITKEGSSKEIMRAVQVQELDTLHALEVTRETNIANIAVLTEHRWDPNPHDLGTSMYRNGKLVHRPVLEVPEHMTYRLELAEYDTNRFAYDAKVRGVDTTFYAVETYLLQNTIVPEGIDFNRFTGLLNQEVTNILAAREDFKAIPENHRDYDFYNELIRTSLPTILHQLKEQTDPEYVENRALSIIEGQAINGLSEMDLKNEFDVLSTFLIKTSHHMQLTTLNAREPALQKLGNPELRYNSQTRVLEYRGEQLSSDKTKARINLAYIMQGKEPIY